MIYVIGGCKYDVVMYMFTVYMRCKNIGIFALQETGGNGSWGGSENDREHI